MPFSPGRFAPLRATAAAAVLALAAFSASLAASETQDAPVPHPAAESQTLAPAFAEGAYSFRFTWNGIPSAEGDLIVSTGTENGIPYYSFAGSARTSKFVDLFWKFRATVVAVVEAVNGRAKKINTVEQERSKVKETETILDYEEGKAQYVRWKKGEKKEELISLEGGVLDLASLGVMLAQRPLEVGDSDSFTVLFKDDRYSLAYEVIARERVSAAGKEYEAFRVEPKFKRISEKEEEAKVRQMTVWLTESEPHIPLRMRSKTFVGHVTGELMKITPKEAEDE